MLNLPLYVLLYTTRTPKPKNFFLEYILYTKKIITDHMGLFDSGMNVIGAKK